MSKLVIKDIVVSKDLDRAAVKQIRGGYLGGWQVARQEPQASRALVPSGIYNITNNYIDYDYNVINQNPTIFNVYNGDRNSGTIVNSFSTLSVNAASPVLIA